MMLKRGFSLLLCGALVSCLSSKDESLHNSSLPEGAFAQLGQHALSLTLLSENTPERRLQEAQDIVHDALWAEEAQVQDPFQAATANIPFMVQ